MKKYLEEIKKITEELESIDPVTDSNVGKLMSLLIRAEQIKKELIND